MADSTGHHHKEYEGQAKIFLAITVIGFLYLIYGLGHAIEEQAATPFNLTKADLTMIPLGGIAFVVFWVVMDKTVFKPILRLIEEREALTSGAAATVDDGKEQLENLNSEYEEKLTAARVEGMQSRGEIVSGARAEAQSINDKAAAKALQEIELARTKLSTESAELKSQLLSEVDQLVDTVVDKATGTPRSATEVMQ